MTSLVLRREWRLPWSANHRDDLRFTLILVVALVGFVLIGIVVPSVSLPELRPSQSRLATAPLARVWIEPQRLPETQPVEQPRQTGKPAEAASASAKLVPEPAPLSRPAQAPLDAARKKAASSGLLQFGETLAAMRGAPSMPGHGSKLSRGQAEAKQVQRAALGIDTSRPSAGVDVAGLSRGVAGPKLAARSTASVSGSQAAQAVATGTGRAAGTGRSDSAIRRIMDRNKAALYAIYQRALRHDPLLQGKLTLEMVIEPSGQVSSVDILFSELGDHSLERKLLTRIRMILFGSEDVKRTRLSYSFDFLPY